MVVSNQKFPELITAFSISGLYNKASGIFFYK